MSIGNERSHTKAYIEIAHFFLNLRIAWNSSICFFSPLSAADVHLICIFPSFNLPESINTIQAISVAITPRMWSPNEPLPGRRSTSQFATSARGLADGRSTSTQKPVTWTLEHFAPGGGHLLIQGWEGDGSTNGPFLKWKPAWQTSVA